MNAEERRVIAEEVRRQVNVILFGSAGAGDTQTEAINDLFPGMPGIEGRPVMHPFGLVSSAPLGTISVVARVGEHAGNRMVIGHRDSGRPADVEKGESALYNAFGQRVYLREGQIQIGSAAADEPAVLGNVMVAFCTEILKQLDTLLTKLETVPAGITTGPGSFIAPNPAYVQAITQIQVALATAKSTYISTASSNIISQEVFTERGEAK